MQKTNLTKRQSEVLFYIKEQIEEQKIPPTIKEICSHFNLSSTNGVYELLKVLEKKGYIVKSRKGISRDIRLVNLPNDKFKGILKENENVKKVTIIGPGSSKNIMNSFINNLGIIELDAKLFNWDNPFALYASDDSMESYGIEKNDLVISQYTEKPEIGSVVIAFVYDILLIRKLVMEENQLSIFTNKKHFPRILLNDDNIKIFGEVKATIKFLNRDNSD